MEPSNKEYKYKFGDLNSWDSTSQDQILYDRTNTGFLSTLYGVAQSRFEKNSLNGITEFKAIVLYSSIDDVNSIPGVLNSNPWGVMSQILSKDSIKTKVSVVARIPELHAHLPIPMDSDGQNYDWQILSMYPVFEGNIEDALPVEGDIVRVSFSNVNTQDGPVYLGKDGAGNTAASSPGGVPQGAQQPSKFNGKMTNEDMKKTAVVYNTDLYIPDHPRAKSKVVPTIFITPDPQDFKKIKRKNSPSQIVIHESVTDSKQVTIATLLGKGAGVHYYVDRNGIIYNFMDPSWVVWHAGTVLSNTSIGIEVENAYHGFDAPGTIKGLWVVPKNKSKSYNIPAKTQLFSIWNLIKKLTIEFGIPMGFPGVSKLKRNLTEHKDGQLKFSWTLVPGSQDLAGVRSHNRTPPHADGVFIEHYVLCMASGFSPDDAYTETVKRAQEEWYSPVPPIKKNG